eukprot:TRINITY_DN2021_c0_g1_i1.p1 TRINITY_DN2021_c0_g1~~TRINITY_DN2021_c0_g1_i1.p1  ORF type:complete len:403 (-),score=159.91 TRINITY_DN2021_c0_g1_i1:54-1262(-)
MATVVFVGQINDIDRLTEFALFIQKLYSDSLNTTNFENLKEFAANQEYFQVIKETIETFNFFTKLFDEKNDEKTIEVAVQLFSSLFVKLNDSQKDKILQSILKQLEQIPVSREVLWFKATNLLYHLFPLNSINRYHIFSLVLSFCIKHNIAERVSPYFDRIGGWLAVWNTNNEQTRNLYKLAYFVSKLETNKIITHKAGLKFLQSLENAPEKELNLYINESIEIILLAISLPSIFLFDNLFQLRAIQQLNQTQHGKLLNLLHIFVSGSLSTFKAFSDSNVQLFNEYKLSKEDCERKIRLLTLVTLANQNTKLSYSTIAHELQIESEQIEYFLISAIGNQIVEGRIDQMNSIFIVRYTVTRSFDRENWEQLKSKLTQWTFNVEHLLTTLRENKLISKKTNIKI